MRAIDMQGIPARFPTAAVQKLARRFRKPDAVRRADSLSSNFIATTPRPVCPGRGVRRPATIGPTGGESAGPMVLKGC